LGFFKQAASIRREGLSAFVARTALRQRFGLLIRLLIESGKMAFRLKALVFLVTAAAIACLYWSAGHAATHWDHFFVYLVVILLSAKMKFVLPGTEETVPISFPLVLLGILELSPLQAVALAVASALPLHRILRATLSPRLRIVLRTASVVVAAVLAWHTYALSLALLSHEAAPALAAAAAVYFVVNSLASASWSVVESRALPVSQWRRQFRWYIPFYLVGALLAAVANYVGMLFGWMTSLLLMPLVYVAYRAYKLQLEIVRDRERYIVETEALHLRTIEGLAMAVEAKDQNTHRHLMRVRVYVAELGKAMGLSKSQMQALATASFLHDIGKLAVPEHIINKPGKLSHEEFEKMKIHPVVGANILERVHFPYPVVPIVRAHHEAWDGSGYPDGLKGKDIPIGARILTAVDCFDALASERPYRRAMPLEEAMAFIKNRAGTQFDPAVVHLLEQRYLALEEMARRQIQEMEPLKTDLLIDRGAAPAAGFEPEQPADGFEEHDHLSRHLNADALAAKSLGLIAAASQEAKALYDLSQMLGTSLSTHETSAMMAKRLRILIAFDCLVVYLRSEESVKAQFIAGDLAHAFSSQHIPLGEGLSGWVAQNKRPIVNGNPTMETNYVVESGTLTENSSALSVPLFDSKGGIFGVLSIYSATHAAFSKDHLRILEAVQSKFSLSLENAFRFRNAEADARIDHLTQLVNMRYFSQQIHAQIQRAAAAGHRFAVGVCDLNSFKAVNDRHGHLKGNDLLRAIAEGFRAGCGPMDIVARMGGDEFAFLFPAMDESITGAQLKKLDDAVQKACIALHIEASISSSIGIAYFPDDGETAEELLGKADREMYLSKQSYYRQRHRGETNLFLVGSGR
jgi:diguanylate cyclase (GGDEF)-like protein/putative nucleotidyltransferase with HDIG domain